MTKSLRAHNVRANDIIFCVHPPPPPPTNENPDSTPENSFYLWSIKLYFVPGDERRLPVDDLRREKDIQAPSIGEPRKCQELWWKHMEENIAVVQSVSLINLLFSSKLHFVNSLHKLW